ncbi:hypothetical protein ACIQGT_40055 [Streptomyces sp. NPDC093108]
MPQTLPRPDSLPRARTARTFPAPVPALAEPGQPHACTLQGR